MSLMYHRFVFRVLPARPTPLDHGCVARRAIPAAWGDSVGPFVVLDHVGPRQFVPGDRPGLHPVPHAGIEMLTLVFAGQGHYRDSLGNVDCSRSGEVRWIRAGRGMVLAQGADERLRREGGPVHAVQLWVNMPRGRKHEAPAHRRFAADEIPAIVYDDGVDIRLVAGWLEGLRGPVTTSGDPFVAHAEMKAGASTELRVPFGQEFGVYALRGRAAIGAVGEPLDAGEIAVSALDGGRISIRAERDTHVLMFGGPPLDAPIIRRGSLVMNTVEELERAFDDYHSGRMGEVPTVM